MRVAPLIVCLWPGLARLWLRGRTSGLLTAVAFAALLNFALAASLLRPELMGSVLARVAWIVVAAWWAVGCLRNFRQLPKLLAPPAPPESVVDLFPQAQAEYLKGHWFEAESLLAKQLRTSPEDADSRLLLASLYRHTGRAPDARHELRRLERCEASRKWRFEIEQEQRLLDEREQQIQEQEQKTAQEQQREATSNDSQPATRTAETPSSRAA